MAQRASISAPTTAALPHAHVLSPSSPLVFKTLAKLSRPSLLSLVLEWLRSSKQTTCAPFLTGDKDDGNDGQDDVAYPAAQSLEELREVYRELQSRKGGKREIVDRILEGDWRRGISLRQLAMADVRYLLDHPTSQRWTALQLKQVTLADGGDSDDEIRYAMSEPRSATLPRFHAPTFLQNLQSELSPFVKAHYYLTRANSMPLTLLRVYIHDSPYNSQRSLLGRNATTQIAGDGSKIIYVAFPDGSPSIYVSLATTPGLSTNGDSRSLRNVVLDALPKAFSRPQFRYTLKPTSLSARSLSALTSLRGPGRGNAAAGGWSIFADGSVEESPLDSVHTEERLSRLPGGHVGEQQNELSGEVSEGQKKRKSGSSGLENALQAEDTASSKRRKLMAEHRFGTSAIEGDGKGIERLDIRIEDAYPTMTSTSDGDSDNEVNPSSDSEVQATQDAGNAQPRRAPRRRTSILDQNHAYEDDDAEPATSTGWKPEILLTFHGSHVFAGIRHLVEAGVVDGVKMPGWMTGENGVSIGTVKDGRILGNKGSGLS